MDSYTTENALLRTQPEYLTHSDYLPMRPGDNPLVALAELLGYHIAAFARELLPGQYVHRYRGEAATVTLYENDLLQLIYHLIEQTRLPRLSEEEECPRQSRAE